MDGSLVFADSRYTCLGYPAAGSYHQNKWKECSLEGNSILRWVCQSPFLCVLLCFVALAMVYKLPPCGAFGGCWGRTPYQQSQSYVSILNRKSSMFLVGVGLCLGCPSSPTLLMLFLNRILRCRWREENAQVGTSGSPFCFLQTIVVLLALSDWDLHHALGQWLYLEKDQLELQNFNNLFLSISMTLDFNFRQLISCWIRPLLVPPLRVMFRVKCLILLIKSSQWDHLLPQVPFTLVSFTHNTHWARFLLVPYLSL